MSYNVPGETAESDLHAVETSLVDKIAEQYPQSDSSSIPGQSLPGQGSDVAISTKAKSQQRPSSGRSLSASFQQLQVSDQATALDDRAGRPDSGSAWPYQSGATHYHPGITSTPDRCLSTDHYPFGRQNAKHASDDVGNAKLHFRSSSCKQSHCSGSISNGPSLLPYSKSFNREHVLCKCIRYLTSEIYTTAVGRWTTVQLLFCSPYMALMSVRFKVTMLVPLSIMQCKKLRCVQLRVSSRSTSGKSDPP